MRKAAFLTFGLLGAVLMSQFPEFFQQYMQRLGGRLDEVTAQANALERRAAERNKDVAAYLQPLLTNSDPDVRQEGERLAALGPRKERLAEAYGALTGAARWWRAPYFVRHMDWEVARTTMEVYQPAAPLSFEGGVYSATGFGIGAVLYGALFGPVRRRRRVRDNA